MSPGRMRFIPTQRILRLEAPPELRRRCLDPAVFRALRTGEPNATAEELRLVAPELADCRWVPVEDRCRFLADENVRRLCITVESGTGKSVAIQQTGWLRGEVHKHLIIRARLSILPTDAARYLTKDGGWLVNQFKSAPRPADVPYRFSAASDVSVARLIRQQIRRGRFTLLVDALDQTAGQDAIYDRAVGLANFLRQHPRICCVVAGRPYAVHERFWSSLFDPKEANCGDWTFARICEFTEAEVEDCIGTSRMRKLRHLDAAELRIPRSLETILEIEEEKLDSIRTASDIYHRAIENMLAKAFRDQDFPNRDVQITRAHAKELFGLLAFEMTRVGNFHGVPAQHEESESSTSEPIFADFIDAIWERRVEQKKRLGQRVELRWSEREKFDAKLEGLGRLNEFLESEVLDSDGLTELFWRNRTLQAYFAAWWLSNNPSVEDIEWLHQNRLYRHAKTRGTHLKTRATHLFEQDDLTETWRLLSEMPQSAMRPASWVRSLSVLYERDRRNDESGKAAFVGPGATRRSTEMLWRSWPRMLQLAGLLTKPDWHEGDVEDVTSRLQLKVRHRIDSGERDFSGEVPASQALYSFLSEFPLMLAGEFGEEIQSTAKDFDGRFVPIPQEPGGSLEYWLSAEPAGTLEDVHEDALECPFSLCDFVLTRGECLLFDAGLDEAQAWSPDLSCPAISLDWYDSWIVSVFFHGRLPSEREWEYACRGQTGRGTATPYWWGNATDEMPSRAWFFSNSKHKAHARGASGHANAFGLYDMLGNVWEWTSSWYFDDARLAKERSLLPDSSVRVLRGGSFSNDASNVRSAYRNWDIPSSVDHIIGIRVARANRENL